MYVVAGVSGNVGSVTANTLLERGERVRVIVRDADKGERWRKQGAEVAVGSLEDVAFLTRALEGTEGAFLLVPPPPYTSQDIYGYQVALVDRIREAVVASRVPRIVVLSSIGAQHAAGTGPIRGLYYAERQLGDATVATFIRASYFMENAGNVLQAVVHNGVYPTFTGESVEMPMIATRDIGALAAKSLLERPTASRVLNLTGPKELVPDEVAGTFARLLGRPVQVAAVPEAAAVGALTGAGLPLHFAEAFAEMYAAVGKGLLAWEEGSPVLRGATTLETVIADLLKR